ncbi:MAG: prepilin-type N-terminal cleavage/methylation domain-containing protein [Candidatus Riflebacteria bacterium]|nr:prepilin-type N-terminal cleavage/methylation domain-containing protein [Candidatus Riflebacteria bacterium]
MHDNRSGFTLMEIMVVVVIIAVLASVAGPMIGDIINQGKASATRSKMSSLKSAIVTYKNDVGRYPFYGDKKQISNANAYDAALVLSGDNIENNVLVRANALVGAGDTREGDAENGYWSTFYGKGGRKWKGPYMDSDPADFMTDSWGTPIKYHAFDHSLILWSAGPDGEFHEDGTNNPHPDVLNSEKYAEGDTDDLFLSIARFRKQFN